MDYLSNIRQHLTQSAMVKETMISECSASIAQFVEIIVAAIRKKNKLLLAGNGGSAADAQHIAAEFVIRLSHDLDRPSIPALALTTDSSILTAGGNDIGFQNVFARQVEGLANPGDIFLAISTSGNSENLIRAIKTAQSKQVTAIALLGAGGGTIKSMTDANILIPSDNTQHIQEGHITAGHIICELVERTLYGQ